MTWLIAHMWIVVGGAVVLSLLLGWSLRGVFLVGRLRRAEVERELTRVELSEAREEIERLFAAQRKMAAAPAEAQAAPPADTALRQQLAEASAELQAVRAELEALKAAPPVIAAPAPVAAAAAPGLIAAEAHDALKQHAAALETEIATLQAALAEARTAAAAPKAEAPAGVAPEVFEALANRAAELEAALKASEAARAAAEAAQPAVAAVPVADAKLAWQAEYLRQRAQALEAELLRQPQPAPAAAEAQPVAAAAPAGAGAEEDSVEQELARLRWRNRYLEGRLAYLEGDAESVAEELAGSAAEAGPETAAGDAAAELPRASEAILGHLEAADAKAEADRVEPVKPMPIDKPFGGVADDLTQIGGIGPKIQDVLNSLGIFHYDQIAEWTPENVAWVDQYLNFEGRISREGWVEQAAVLVGEEADA